MTVVGTPYYMSPELCRGKPYNQKSDIWAVGCVLYELSTFRHAFDATNLPALVMNIVSRDYDPVLEQSYSQQFKDFIGLCLRKLPEERPSVEELLSMPLTVRATDEARRDADRRMAESSRTLMPKPFFDFGTVEPSASSSSSSQSLVLSAKLKDVEEDGNFERFIAVMRDRVDVRDRVQSRVPYFKCFTGKALVDYLTDTLRLSSREGAAIIGQRWMDAGIFYHVTRGESFSDEGSSSLFRFKQDEVGSILNMKQPYSGETIGAMEGVAALRDATCSIYSRFGSRSVPDQDAAAAAVNGVSVSGAVATSIDYESLALSTEFKMYCDIATAIQSLNLDSLDFSEKTSFFLNLYNLLVIHAFVVIGPPTTAAQRLHFYNHTCLNIGGEVFSLSEIKHGMLRANKLPHNALRPVLDRKLSGHAVKLRHAMEMRLFDSRVHFALVDGSLSCPALRVYSAATLDDELTGATTAFLLREVEVREEAEDDSRSMRTVLLPAVFNMYDGDFGSTNEEVIRWICSFLPPGDRTRATLSALVDEGSSAYTVRYKTFNWQLNKSLKPPPPPGRAQKGHTHKPQSPVAGRYPAGVPPAPVPPPSDPSAARVRPSKSKS